MKTNCKLLSMIAFVTASLLGPVAAQTATTSENGEAIPVYSVQAKLVRAGATVVEKTFDVAAGSPFIADGTSSTDPATRYHLGVVVAPGPSGYVFARTSFSTETKITKNSIAVAGQRLDLPELQKCSYEAPTKISLNAPQDVRTGEGRARAADGAIWPSCSLVLTIREKATK